LYGFIEMGTYIVAGSSSGIGHSIALNLLNQGHEVIGFNRNQPNFEHSNFSFHEADFSQLDVPLPELNQSIDGIFYCPGSIQLRPFKNIKSADFINDFMLNVIGATQLIKKYLPQLQLAASPGIVLFSSVAAQTGMSFHSSIASSKAAIEGLTKSLAAEFAPKIRVNAIAPSLTQTALSEKFINTEEKLQASKDRHPLKRIGTAEEIAISSIHIMQNQWMTGQIITIDGGLGSIR
jgi:3-oxoacyl-[acyl-carrier protein] reductase